MVKFNKEFWEELFPLTRHESNKKRHVQQVFYCVLIRCRGNVFTEPLPSNDRHREITLAAEKREFGHTLSSVAYDLGSASLERITVISVLGAVIQLQGDDCNSVNVQLSAQGC
jgi:hypothetical protein